MKMTLLEIVQSILSSMNSDEVNSITDTTESLQVANAVKDTYLSLVGKLALPETKTIIQLTASGDVTKPVLMTLPNNVENLEYLKYNKVLADGVDRWDYVQYMPLSAFIEQMQMKSTITNGTMGSFTYTANGMSMKVYYTNDKNPDWFTSIDDHTLLFDSYFVTVDDTLKNSKSLGYGTYTYAFTLSDSFIPQLDSNQFALLLNDAKVQVFNDLKEQENPTAKKRAKDHLIHGQKIKNDMPMSVYGSPYDRLPNYGRGGWNSGPVVTQKAMRSSS